VKLARKHQDLSRKYVARPILLNFKPRSINGQSYPRSSRRIGVTTVTPLL
jgi:hypothetical protein